MIQAARQHMYLGLDGGFAGFSLPAADQGIWEADFSRAVSWRGGSLWAAAVRTAAALSFARGHYSHSASLPAVAGFRAAAWGFSLLPGFAAAGPQRYRFKILRTGPVDRGVFIDTLRILVMILFLPLFQKTPARKAEGLILRTHRGAYDPDMTESLQ